VSRKGWLLFCALCVIWGFPYLLIRVAVRELTPATLVFARTAPVALAMLPFAWRRGELRALIGRWRWVLAFTLVEISAPWLLLAHAEQQLPSSMAGLLIASVPLIAAVLYRITGTAEHLTGRRLAGLVLGFVGVVALVGFDTSGGHPRAVIEVLVVALCYAIGPLVISRRLADLRGLGVVVASLAITAVVYAPFGLTQLPATVSAETVAAVVALALVCTALAFVLFFALIVEVGPARATVITYINPLVAVLLGVVFLSEPLTAGMAVGLPLILGGSVLATSRSPGRRRPEEASRPPVPDGDGRA
jgi:drug/metabolite transporter (DMT)-like permease